LNYPGHSANLATLPFRTLFSRLSVNTTLLS
jgi:hypothetical protein